MDATVQWFVSLMSPEEWKAVAWLLMVVLAGTHTLKILWRNCLPIKGGSGPQMALVASTLSMVTAYFIWPAGSVHWALAGIVGGPASNIAFKLGFAILKRFAPDMAATVNLDRRRTEGPLPPQGTPERRQ